MASNLSPQAQQRVAALIDVTTKVQRVHGLVEQYAAEKDPQKAEVMALPVKRAFARLKLDLMGAGLDSLSQLSGAMEIAAGRGGNPRVKARILREGVGSMKFQLEMEQRQVVQQDKAAKEKEEAK